LLGRGVIAGRGAEGSNTRSYIEVASSMDSLICTERISRCVKGEYTGRIGDRRDRI